MMSKLLLSIIELVIKFGNLASVTMFDDTFAKVEVDIGGKAYKVSITETKEKENA